MCARKKEEKDPELDPELISRTKNTEDSTGSYYFEKTKTYLLSKSLRIKVDAGYKATLYPEYMDPITVTKCSEKNLMKIAKLRNELIGKPFYVIFEYVNHTKASSEWGFCTDPFKFTDRPFRVGANGHITIAVTDCDRFIKTACNNEPGVYYTETVYATIIKEFEKMARPLLVDVFDDVHPFVKSADYLLENYNIKLEDFFFAEPNYFDRFGVKLFLPESNPNSQLQNASDHLAENVYVNKDCLESEAKRFKALQENAQKQEENEKKRIYEETEMRLAEEARILEEEEKRLADEEKRREEEEKRLAEEEQAQALEIQRMTEEIKSREKALQKREEKLKKREDKHKKNLKDSLIKIENAKKLEKEILQRIETAKKLEADAVKKAEAANALERELTDRIEELNNQLKASMKSDDTQTAAITEQTDTDSASKGKKTVKKTVVKRVPKPSDSAGETDQTAEVPSESTARKTVVVKKTIVKKKSPDASGTTNTVTDGSGHPNA